MRPIPNVVFDDLIIAGDNAGNALDLLMAVAMRSWLYSGPVIFVRFA